MTKAEVLDSLVPLFAHTNSEDDDLLRDYFVETDAWRGLVAGRTDLFKGARGSGKSALYLLLYNGPERAGIAPNIVLVSAEEPIGSSVFKQALSERLREDSELKTGRASPIAKTIGGGEFKEVWQWYFLTIIVARLRQLAKRDEALGAKLGAINDYQRLVDSLESAGLLAAGKARPFKLDVMLRRVMRSVRTLKTPLFDFDVRIGPGQQEGAERTHADTASDGLDYLNEILTEADLAVWVLVDRLDDAFENQTGLLESTGLLALVETYRDLKRFKRIKLKLFVRSDIYARALATDQPKRSLEKVEREQSIDWELPQLVDIIVRRLLVSEPWRRLYGLAELSSLPDDYGEQRRLLQRMLPQQMNGSEPLEWIYARLADGNGLVTPRSFIKLISFAIDRQRKRKVFGAEEVLLDETSLGEAVALASKEYYEKAFCAEHPDLQDFAASMHGQPSGNTLGTLTSLWKHQLKVPMKQRTDLAKRIAKELVDAGLLRHDGNDLFYYVAPLYEPILNSQPGRSAPHADDVRQLAHRSQ